MELILNGDITRKVAGVSVFSDHDAERFDAKMTTVLLDFWAPWCAPCRGLEPTLAKLRNTFSDDLMIIKVNVDLHSNAVMNYNIRSIPTLLLLRDKEEIKRVAAAEYSEEMIIKEIADVLMN